MFPIGIKEYRLTSDEIEKISEYVKKIDISNDLWHNSETESKTSNYRVSESYGIPVQTEFDSLVFKIFNEKVNMYRNDFPLIGDLNDEGYTVLRYSEGGKYKQHCDQTTHGPGATRVLSGIIYVNDDYTGGGIEFSNFKMFLKPTKGTVLLFPSNFVFAHEALPVLSGKKFAIVTFFSK